MHLSVLKLWNFRKYCEGPNGEPGLVVHFHEGVNVLIGENDSVNSGDRSVYRANTEKRVNNW